MLYSMFVKIYFERRYRLNGIFSFDIMFTWCYKRYIHSTQQQPEIKQQCSCYHSICLSGILPSIRVNIKRVAQNRVCAHVLPHYFETTTDLSSSRFPTFAFNDIRMNINLHTTECPKSYRKSVLHLLKYTENLYLSRCSTDLR